MNQEDNLIRPGMLDYAIYDQEDQPYNYSQADLKRIGLIKISADTVYKYFADILDDYRILEDAQKHNRKVEAMVADVCQNFGLSPEDNEVAKYFISNVLKSSQVFEEVTIDKSFLPFSDDLLKSLYIKEHVIDFFHGKPANEVCQYAGVFVSDTTDTHPKLTSIQEARLVGCDMVFVQTLAYGNLIDGADEQVQEDAEDDLMGTVGNIVASAPMGLFDDDLKPL